MGVVMQNLYLVTFVHISGSGEIYPHNFLGLSRNEAFKKACEFLNQHFGFPLPLHSIDFITDTDYRSMFLNNVSNISHRLEECVLLAGLKKGVIVSITSR